MSADRAVLSMDKGKNCGQKIFVMDIFTRVIIIKNDNIEKSCYAPQVTDLLQSCYRSLFLITTEQIAIVSLLFICAIDPYFILNFLLF